MKDLFKNSVGKNTARITLNSQGKTFCVYFYLNDNPVQHHWQEIHSSNSLFETRPMTNLGLERTVDLLNQYTEKVNEKKIGFPICQEELNYLHSRYVNAVNNHNEYWQMINTLIHNIESISQDPFVDYNCTVNFIKRPDLKYVPIKEEYKLWLTTNHRWGDLILGFGTLGKDWLDIFRNNDSLEDLNIQKTINSETSIFFHLENPSYKFEEKGFYPWAIKNNISLEDLNKLSLGKYILGQIIITKDFLDFNPNISDWYVPNHICKLKWNKHFIGPDTTVIGIDFFDSDMYYDSLIEHSKLFSIYE